MRAGTGLCACAAVVALVIVGAATKAAAHAELLETQPAAGERLDTAPEEVVLRYSEAVDPSDDAIEVFDSDGERLDTTRPRHPDGDSARVAVDLPSLDDGTYVVTWRVASEDSHPIRGAFTFRVGDASDAGAEDAEALMDRLVASEGGDITVGALYGAVRFAAFVGMVLLVGGTFFLVVVWPGGITDRRARRLLVAGWATVLAATVVGFGFQAAYTTGVGLGGVLDSAAIGDVVATRPGRVWLVRLLLLAVAAAAGIVLDRRLRAEAREAGAALGSAVAAVAGVVGMSLLTTVSLAGHAAAGDFVALALVTDVVHLGAVSFWLGGLALLLTVVLRGDAGRRSPGAAAPSTVGAAGVVAEAPAAYAAAAAGPAAGTGAGPVVARFSTLAAGAVAVLAVSGAVQGWRQTRSVDGLVDTTYGRVLAVKVVLVAVMLGAAAASRSWVRRRAVAATRPGAAVGGDGGARHAVRAGDGPAADLPAGGAAASGSLDEAEGGSWADGGEGPAGEGSAGEGPAGEGPAGEGLAGEGPAGEGSAGEGLTGEGSVGEGLTGEGSVGEGLAGEGSAGEGAAGEGAAGERSAVGQASGVPGGPPLRALRRSVGIEAVVAGLVLAVTALLVNTVPGKDAVSSAFSAELHGTAALVEVEIEPAEVGPADIHITTRTHQGQVLEPLDVQASLSLPSRDVPPIPLALAPQEPGVYVAEAADIPFTGRWTLEIEVRTGEFDQESLRVDVPVR